MHKSVSQQAVTNEELVKEDNEVNEHDTSFDSSISNWSQLITVVKNNPSFQMCQEFVNSLGQKVKV